MALITGSVITRALRVPNSARSIPTSRVTPAPKRMLDTAISNAISLVTLLIVGGGFLQLPKRHDVVLDPQLGFLLFQQRFHLCLGSRLRLRIPEISKRREVLQCAFGRVM